MTYVIYRMVMRLFVLVAVTVTSMMAMRLLRLWGFAMIVGHGIDGVDVLFGLKMSLVIFVLHLIPPLFTSKSARNHRAAQYL